MIETFRESQLAVFIGITVIVLSARSGCKDAGSEPPPVPVIVSIEPDSGAVGADIKVKGTSFGNVRGSSTVRFGSVPGTVYDEWKDNEIKLKVPSVASGGIVPLTVQTDGGVSNSRNFKVIGQSGGVDSVRFSTHIQPIFNTNGCIGCHPSNFLGLSLQSGQSYNNLVDVQAQAGCTDRKRVLPGNADQSVLYLRISGTTCGDRMPKNMGALAPEDIQKIRDWINQGASNN
jgi:hypothetical protein